MMWTGRGKFRSSFRPTLLAKGGRQDLLGSAPPVIRPLSAPGCCSPPQGRPEREPQARRHGPPGRQHQHREDSPTSNQRTCPLMKGPRFSSALLLLLRGQGCLTGRSLPHRAGVIKWAVTKGLGLRIMPSDCRHDNLYHSLLSGGDPVLAAGEAQIVGWEGRYYGRYITYHSGHFQPGEESLDIGINAFRDVGIEFDETGSY
jgi:hypothetical protein